MRLQLVHLFGVGGNVPCVFARPPALGQDLVDCVRRGANGQCIPEDAQIDLGDLEVAAQLEVGIRETLNGTPPAILDEEIQGYVEFPLCRPEIGPSPKEIAPAKEEMGRGIARVIQEI